jgi:propionyl-CoA carboxylase beta chain
MDEYRARFANPQVAAGRGYVDDVVDPRHLRTTLINAFNAFANKRQCPQKKKHGIMPV